MLTIPNLRKTDSERSAEENQKRMGLLGATIRIYMLQQYHTNAEAGEYPGVTGPTYKRLTDCADLMRVADLQKLAAIIPEEQKESIRRMILP